MQCFGGMLLGPPRAYRICHVVGRVARVRANDAEGATGLAPFLSPMLLPP